MVGVDAHLILFEVEGILTGLDGTQLMVAVEVWPPPQATVNDVRKPLTLGDLQATIQGSGRAVKGTGIRWRGVRKEKGWGRNLSHQSCLEHQAGLGVTHLVWSGKLYRPDVSHCSIVFGELSPHISEQLLRTKTEQKQQHRRHDKHGAGLIWKQPRRST